MSAPELSPKRRIAKLAATLAPSKRSGACVRDLGCEVCARQPAAAVDLPSQASDASVALEMT